MRENPWEGIGASPGSTIRAKRVGEAVRHNFFWACNAEGRYALLYQADAELDEWAAPAELRGITVGYFREQRQFQLVLSNASEWEIFLVLCEDLIRASDRCESAREVINAIKTRLGRWQRLLSRGPRRRLDDSTIRGLIGELLVIRDHLIPVLGAETVDSWQGPERLPQDFVFGAYLVEVKTILRGDKARIHISSPDQLWNGNLTMYLAVFSLAHSVPMAAGAVTLPLLVEQISTALENLPQLEIFERRLGESGYAPFPEYSEAAYTFEEARWFEVREDFPRIEPDGIPAGVESVHYTIPLNAIARYESKPNVRDFVQGAK